MAPNQPIRIDLPTKDHEIVGGFVIQNLFQSSASALTTEQVRNYSEKKLNESSYFKKLSLCCV